MFQHRVSEQPSACADGYLWLPVDTIEVAAVCYVAMC